MRYMQLILILAAVGCHDGAGSIVGLDVEPEPGATEPDIRPDNLALDVASDASDGVMADLLESDTPGSDDRIDIESMCDVGSMLVPFSPDDDYLGMCARTDCCDEGWSFDPAPMGIAVHQVEWSMAPDHPLPECVTPDPNVLVVRVKWWDIRADDPSLCPTGPCGGHCVPSAGKVYLLDVVRDSVQYLGDEDPESWGPPTDLEPVLGGRRLDLGPDKAYIFRGHTPGFDVRDGIARLAPWAACFVEVERRFCLHFPLQAEPGECPLHLPEYEEGQGRCQVW